MAIFQVKLIEKRIIAPKTLEIKIEKPANFKFQAGQFCSLGILDEKFQDAKGSIRELSFSSSPNENLLTLALRMSNSAFKKNLDSISAGESLRLDGPYGNFTLSKPKKCIFIAGGIGVTPILSILKTHKSNAILFNINQTKSSDPYLNEIDKLIKSNSDLQLVNVYTREYKPENNSLSAELFQKHIKNISESHFYIAGSSSFVRFIKNVLLKLDVKSSQIRTEEFFNY